MTWNKLLINFRFNDVYFVWSLIQSKVTFVLNKISQCQTIFPNKIKIIAFNSIQNLTGLEILENLNFKFFEHKPIK